jgi:hypothetical protein
MEIPVSKVEGLYYDISIYILDGYATVWATVLCVFISTYA